MQYIWQHIRSILDLYEGGLPLSHFLKNYFRQYPRLGSRDRRVLSEMAYCWYRSSKGFLLSDFQTHMQAVLLACGPGHKHVLPFLPEHWRPAATGDADARIRFLQSQHIPFDPEALFPYPLSLSAGINRPHWLRSMLGQPRLFLRLRKDHQRITGILEQQGLDYQFITDNCLSLPNGSAIEQLLPADSYVIQDASSQATGRWMQARPGSEWYDCCAGAGGKSLLLTDLNPGIRLLVSDVRNSILHNLKLRFKQYGLKPPPARTLNAADAQQLQASLGSRLFDGIICDVPCSGSGTWARTPEQLYYFSESQLNRINESQKAILMHMAGRLKPGGRLLYITCSVFEAENEAVVQHVLAQSRLRLVEQQLINGLAHQADSLFIAVLEPDQ